MPLLTPHWDAPRKKAGAERVMTNYVYHKKTKSQKVYDPTKMTLLERSSLERSKLCWLHKNRDIKIGGPWGPRIARQIVKCLNHMNTDIDVIVLAARTSPIPITEKNKEYNQEYYDVWARWHRITFDGQPVPEAWEPTNV
jgi:hypothetical protein